MVRYYDEYRGPALPQSGGGCLYRPPGVDHLMSGYAQERGGQVNGYYLVSLMLAV